MRLKDKVAIVTGSASGMGAATAQLFAAEGAKVVLTDILEEDGSTLAAEISGDAQFQTLDVTSEGDWEKLVAVTLSAFGRVDILINNAGVSGSHPDLLNTTTWDEQMNVHAKGTFLGTKHAIPAMRKSGGGSIINVSSINGLVAATSSTAYCAAKGAIRIFSKASAVQYAKENIRVNSVHPGYTKTPLNLSLIHI